MKDSRQCKEGVELLLDNRQIFLLFVASAVILALVFTLGVVVGRRTSAPPDAAPTTDPLAMLDQMGAGQSSAQSLTFHEELTEGKGAQVLTRPAPPPEPDETGAANRPDRADKGLGRAKKANSAKKVNRAKKANKAKAASPAGAPPKVAAKAAPAPAAAPAQGSAGADEDEAADAEAAGTYSLQVSSFQDRTEAKLFMKKLEAQGLKPFMIRASIPGRGLWYRVRIGSFGSWEKAVEAKQRFERNLKTIAYVAKN